MAPLRMPIGMLNVLVTAVPLTSEAFAAFGDVIHNPLPGHPPDAVAVHPDKLAEHDAVSANQGSAIKFQRVSRPVNLYAEAPSGVPGEAIVSLFVCGARELTGRRGDESLRISPSSGLTDGGPGKGPEIGDGNGVGGYFVVEILERHPFTTQTFIPLRCSHGPGGRYLVLVAPSLRPDEPDKDFPAPATDSLPAGPGGRPSRQLPGRGLPDLARLRAFIAMTDQAVTYGAGTWHAPMVALGPKGSAIDFVVTQTANGVGIEDCQEVVFQSDGATKPRVAVRVLGQSTRAKL